MILKIIIIKIITIIIIIIFHILLSNINYLSKNDDNVGNIGIDVSTSIHKLYSDDDMYTCRNVNNNVSYIIVVFI